MTFVVGSPPVGTRITARSLALERGMPIRAILRAEYRQHGTLAAIAESLGVRPGTVRNWMSRFGLSVKARRRIVRARKEAS